MLPERQHTNVLRHKSDNKWEVGAVVGRIFDNSDFRDNQVIAKELHALLKKANGAPPFVMVGHSMGGLDMRMYTSLYPSDVVGMAPALLPREAVIRYISRDPTW